MNQILRWALDYCDIYMPFFHRPTLNLSRSPPVLLLALCSLGAFLSRTQEYYEVGKLLHRHVWSQTIEVGNNPVFLLQNLSLHTPSLQSINRNRL